MPGGDKAFIVSPEEALVLARALIIANTKFREEYDKIAFTPDVSEFLKLAAGEQYNAISEPSTRLHMALAEHFPALRQV